MSLRGLSGLTGLSGIVASTSAVAWTPASAVFALDATAMRTANKLFSGANGTGSPVTTDGGAILSLRCSYSNTLFNVSGTGLALTDLGSSKWGLTSAGSDTVLTSATLASITECVFGVAGQLNFATQTLTPFTGVGVTPTFAAPAITIDGAAGSNTIYTSPDFANNADLDLSTLGLTTNYYTIMAQSQNSTGSDILTYLNKFDFRSGAIHKTVADLVADGGNLGGLANPPSIIGAILGGMGTWIMTRATLQAGTLSDSDFIAVQAWMAAGNN